MFELQAFRQRVQALYRAADPFSDGHRPTTEDLAREIGLSRTELSRRLSGRGKVPLSHPNAQAIIRALAKWGALQTQAQAIELLALVGCPPSELDWQAPPLDRLASLSSTNQARLVPGGSNLPLQLTSFVGRDEELAELSALLKETRLLTLTGAGGMGKTRLATEVAAGLLDQYPDGCWLVGLAPLADGRHVIGVLAQALGVREEPGRAITETLGDYLRPRKLLLVLDNCEHVLSACAELAKLLLSRCPGLRILATSREPLGIAGEVEWRLSPLGLPGATEQLSSAQAERYAAVGLFVARARAALPRFRLNERNTPGVVQVCRRLEGIPLALELAAPLVKVLSVEQIARRLDDRFRLLRSSDPSAPTRQQTLRASIEWSYDLLGEADRTLLRRLAVFAGSWSLEAAEVICGGASSRTAVDPQTEDVLGGHVRLVNKSLVQANEQAGTARYSMLETVCQFAAERLTNSGEGRELRRRHANLYLSLAEQAEPQLSVSAQNVWFARLELEHDNLRTALKWLLENGDSEAALRLGSALCRFWAAHDHLSEGRSWLEQALAAGPSSISLLRARALGALGWLYTVDHKAAAASFEQALAIYRALGDEAGIATTLSGLSIHVHYLGDDKKALACYEEGFALTEKLGDKETMARAVYSRGRIAFDQRDYPTALRLHEQALAIYRELGDKRRIAFSLAHLGVIADAQRDHATARMLQEQSLDLFEEVGDRNSAAAMFSSLGTIANDQGDYQASSKFLARGLAIRRELGDRRGIGATLTYYATLAEAVGRPDLAALLFGAAEALREATNNPIAPEEQDHYTRHLAATRAQLDEASFNSAWSLGRTLTEEQAIVRALSLPIPAGTPISR